MTVESVKNVCYIVATATLITMFIPMSRTLKIALGTIFVLTMLVLPYLLTR